MSHGLGFKDLRIRVLGFGFRVRGVRVKEFRIHRPSALDLVLSQNRGTPNPHFELWV